MSNYEVPEPILNSPYEEPQQYWRIEEGETPEKMTGRRPAMYFYRDPKAKPDTHGHHPIAMLGGLWEKDAEDWKANRDDPRPPVFILVCKNTQIARVVYDWIAEGKAPTGIPPAKIEGFRNRDGVINTIRVDMKVVHETDCDSHRRLAAVYVPATVRTGSRPRIAPQELRSR